MPEIDDGGPAFPVNRTCDDKSGEHCVGNADYFGLVNHGMSLRIYIAVEAMKGIIASLDYRTTGTQMARGPICDAAYLMADVMLAARLADPSKNDSKAPPDDCLHDAQGDCCLHPADA